MSTIADVLGHQPLPRGRHRLSREDVSRSQHGRLCLAVLDVSATKGYAATTVADLARAAAVSKRTFYELFDSLDSCFAAALEVCVQIALTNIDDAVPPDGPRDWRSLLAASIRVYLESLAAEPNAARAMHVEILSAGPLTAAERLLMMTVFADRMRAVHQLALQQDPSLPTPPPAAFEFFVDGLDGRIRHHLVTAEAATLPTLAPLLMQCTLALFGQPEY